MVSYARGMQEHIAPANDASSNHPPLARDLHGNLVELPKGTCAWRIGRETTGRPRIILAPDNQPMRFPLHLTCEQLVEMCGPDVYHVYAVDEFGNVLGRVTKLDANRDMREPRNGFATDVAMPSASRAAYGPMTDLRFALEAMAQMMRTNSEALRAVTASQADWVKAIAVAKGLPRNVAFPMLAPPPAHEAAGEDEDEDEYDDAPGVEAPTNIYDVVNTAIEKFGGFVPGMVMGKGTGGASAAASAKKLAARNAAPVAHAQAVNASSDIDWDLVNAPDWEFRDFVDHTYAYQKGQAKRAAKALEHDGAHQAADTTSLAAGETLEERLARDPALVSQLMAIQAQLTPDEVQLVTGEVRAASPAEQEKFIQKVKTLSVEEAVAGCRELAATAKVYRAQFASNAADGTAG